MAMKWKKNNNSLFQSVLREHPELHKLDKINQCVDWNKIKKVLSPINYQKTSLAYDPLLLFKCLLLQTWDDLSDQGLESGLVRDLLFKRFVGLDMTTKVPDHSTIFKVRARLEGANIAEVLLGEVNEQIVKNGIEIKGGKGIVDASVVEASRCRVKKGKGGKDTRDKEGGYWTKKDSSGKQKMACGYKVHVNCNEKGIVKRVEFTKANVHDSRVMKDLLADEREVYGDSAYRSKKYEEYLRKKGKISRIQKKGYRNKPPA